ncbi:type II secretion system F family protein [bacterium]|nr:MAG: type II secretion system F family protein [bacterium]|tara:strand:+ start:1437 stop:2672 length:1236 start_codon:yes stop_codon:yes gene_type:complete
MPEFSYIARTQEGVRKEDIISAKNINEASELLVSENLSVVKITERDTSFDFMGPFMERFNLSVDKFKNRIPLTNLVFFTRQLSTMFNAGLTLEKAITFLSKEEKHKGFKKVITEIESDVKKGLLLSDALNRHAGVFNNLYVSLVQAGEVSGKLATTLEELAKYLEAMEDTQRKVKSAMYYPTFILIFLGLVMVVLFAFIIPQFTSVYDQLNADLPIYTQMLLDTGDWLSNNLITFFSVITFSLIAIWLIFLTDRGRLFRDNMLLKLPIFGSIFNQSVLSKFGKTFGILVGSGISVIETMNLVKKVVDNRVYELAIEKAAKQIENGSSISDALKLTDIFPGVLIQLMNTGEETGEIDKLAIKASDFYAKQVDAIVDRLTSIIEPALIILIGVIIGVVLVAVYMPIFKFGNAF